MRIALGSDHAGFPPKERVKTLLEELGHEVVEFGCFSAQRCDYPDYCRPAAEAVRNGECHRCIVFGCSGDGEAIVANRVPRRTRAVMLDEETARLGREHNDANGLALGARVIEQEQALEIVRIWLDRPSRAGATWRAFARSTIQGTGHDDLRVTRGRRGSRRGTRCAPRRGTERPIPAPFMVTPQASASQRARAGWHPLRRPSPCR